MCGIAGILNFTNEKIEPNRLDRMRHSLSKRGPDGYGVYHSTCQRFSMIHTRLSILDLSDAGHQPMTYGNSELWITFNGEIYNFLELRNELKGLGYTFRTETDTEVLLAAYIEWGEACQFRFNGMWAFAIWDNKQKTLFLSRDRFGVKPLYFSNIGGIFSFASEQNTLLLGADSSPSINRDIASLAVLTPLLTESFEDCLFNGCKRLLPGCSLVVNASGQLKQTRWWKTFEHMDPQVKSLEKSERDSAFKESFLNACSIRMRSDTDIAFALSGGMDSSSVLCGIDYLINGRHLRLERQPKLWNRAFTATYPGTEQDEIAWAKIPAESTNTPLDVIDVQANISVDLILSCIKDVGDVVEPAIGPWLMYRHMRERGFKVSLEGHGPDEYLAGYSYYWQPYLADILGRDASLAKLVSAMSGLLDSLPSDSQSSKSFFTQTVRGARPENILPFGSINEAAFQKLRDTTCFFDDKEMAFLSECSHLERRLYLDFHVGSLPAILRNFDRCSMAHSIEVRSPFLDWGLVCLGFSLPSEDKIHHGWTKNIIRRGLDFLPRQITERRSKVGFCSPMESWLSNQLKELVQDTVASAGFVATDWCNGAKIRDQVNECYRYGEMAKLRLLWPAINIQLLATMAGSQ